MYLQHQTENNCSIPMVLEFLRIRLVDALFLLFCAFETLAFKHFQEKGVWGTQQLLDPKYLNSQSSCVSNFMIQTNPTNLISHN